MDKNDRLVQHFLTVNQFPTLSFDGVWEKKTTDATTDLSWIKKNE